MARNQRYNDWGKAYKACSMAIVGAGKALNGIATVELQDVAKRHIRELDAQWPHSSSKSNGAKFGGDHDHPWWSGQMHDSVAVRIMDRNRIVSVHYMPPSPDTGEPQHTETIKNIIGAEYARQIAEEHGARYLLPGVQVQLIVGVPYADKVNQSARHSGFMDSLADDLFSKVNQWIFDGGLSRPTVIADSNGKAKVVNKTNVTRR